MSVSDLLQVLRVSDGGFEKRGLAVPLWDDIRIAIGTVRRDLNVLLDGKPDLVVFQRFGHGDEHPSDFERHRHYAQSSTRARRTNRRVVPSFEAHGMRKWERAPLWDVDDLQLSLG